MIATTWFALVALGLAPASAQDGGSCEAAAPTTGPVSLILLASADRVQALAASVKNATIVSRDASTVVFSDGRVISADAASVGTHLNALGWANRPIRVTASFKPRAARPRRYG